MYLLEFVMNMHKIKHLLLSTISILLLLGAFGCSPKTSEAESSTPQAGLEVLETLPAQEISETAAEVPASQPQEALPAITLSEQAYVSPSDAFSLNLPENWNCSETGQYRVDCHSADNSGTVIARAISTGYELTQDSFLILVQAELVNHYEDVKAYTEISRDASEGSVINQATWREGEVYWQGRDNFLRSGPAVYYLTFAATQERFEEYLPAFDEILQKAQFTSNAMSGAPLYAPRKEYVSREKIFSLQVPTSWSKFADASLDRTVVEGFTSPDGRAGVQVALFAKGSHISQETKGVKTLEIMHELYGWDVRVQTDKVLSDGREWLTWYGDRKGIYGSTYFDSSGTSLYIFSVIWEDATKDLYMPVLDEIVASFAYEY